MTGTGSESYGRLGRKVSLVMLGVVFLLSVGTAGAASSVPIVNCRLERALLPPNGSDADHVRIQMRARKVDGYLPRCDLATFVAYDAGRDVGAYHARIVEKGARWYVGAFACSYRYEEIPGRDGIRIATKCVHTGRYASTVWFDSYA